MPKSPATLIVFLLLTGLVCPVAAQIEGAPQSTGGLFGGRRPLDPNRTSQHLTLTLDFGSGYDQNVEPVDGSASPIQQFLPNQSGYVSSATGTLRYQRGRIGRSIEGSGRAYISHATAGAAEVVGGAASLQGSTGIGRRSGLTANISAAYEPTFLFNAFGPIAEQIEGGVVPGASPTHGITEQPWLATRTSATVYRNWTPRQRMEVRYGIVQREPVSGVGFDSRSQEASLRHSWSLRQNAGLDFAYRFGENQQTDQAGIGRPLRQQTAAVTLRLSKRLSPNRRLDMTLGAGATESRSRSALDGRLSQFVLPTVSAATRLDLTRTWNVAADARRSITVLDGLSPEPFLTDAVSLRLIGVMARRMQIAATGSYSRGESRFTETGAFETLVGTAQVQVALSRLWALFSSYTHYQHQLNDITFLPSGFPSRYNLNSVRVGTTFWLPLYGSS